MSTNRRYPFAYDLLETLEIPEVEVGDEVILWQFPLGGEISVSHGRVLTVDEHQITYDLDTFGGSSGGHIYLLGHPIGIHSGRLIDD